MGRHLATEVTAMMQDPTVARLAELAGERAALAYQRERASTSTCRFARAIWQARAAATSDRIDAQLDDLNRLRQLYRPQP